MASSNSLKGGSKGNLCPYSVEDQEQELTVKSGTPQAVDTRGKAPKETFEQTGEAPLRLPGGEGNMGPEASPVSALDQFTTSKAGGRYGGNKETPADIPLSSNGPETRDGV